MMGLRGGATALLLALTACGSPPSPDPWILWNLDTLASRGDPAVTPAGATLRLLSSPFPAVGSGSGLQSGANAGLTIFPAFSEGQPAAYMTTEEWFNFDEVWVQPLYIDLSGKNKPIFGVNAGTRFYSPFWQVFFYSAPAGGLTSARQVIDARVALQPGPGKYCAITADPSIVAALQKGDSVPRRPISGEPVGMPLNGTAFADGELVWFIDLGNQQRFTWDYETLVVEETPLFAFALRDGVPLDLPRVGGTGPWHSPRCDGKGACAAVVNNVPEFGSLWRVWQVLLPAAADVYVPSTMPALAAAVRSMGFPVKVPDSAVPDMAAYALRVVANGADCAAAKAPCQWLDSQNAIESFVSDWRTTETGDDVACPLVLFNGKAIGP